MAQIGIGVWPGHSAKSRSGGGGVIVPQRTFNPTPKKSIHSGHSLTDAYVDKGTPNTFRTLWAEFYPEANAVEDVVKSVIVGSPTSYRWDERWQLPEGQDAVDDIAGFQTLVLAEGGPIASPESLGDSVIYERYLTDLDYEGRYYANARDNGDGGAGAETLLWTIWPAIDDEFGPFRQLLDEYEYSFHVRQQRVMAANPGGAYIHIIPGHRLMIKFYDDIQNGVFPEGITDIQTLFDDNIHPNAIGCYACTLMVLSVMLAIDPRETVYVPDLTVGETDYGTPEMVSYIKNAVWGIVSTYARAGLGGSDMGAIEDHSELIVEEPETTLSVPTFLKVTQSEIAAYSGSIESATFGGRVFSKTIAEGTVTAGGGLNFVNSGLAFSLPETEQFESYYGIIAMNSKWGGYYSEILGTTLGNMGQGLAIRNFRPEGENPDYALSVNGNHESSATVARNENIVLEFYRSSEKAWVFGMNVVDPRIYAMRTEPGPFSEIDFNYVYLGAPAKVQPWDISDANTEIFGCALFDGVEPSYRKRKTLRAWAVRQFPSV